MRHIQPTPYGNPYHNAVIPLIVHPGSSRQLWYPRNINQRQLPPNIFNRLLDEEAQIWRWIIANGGLERICPAASALYRDPPWVKQPALGRRMNKIGSIPLPANGSGDQLVLSFIVPQGWDGAIINTVNEFTGQNFVEGSGDITWRLRINQRWVKDLGNVQTTLGTTATPWTVNNGSIRIQAHQLIQWFVNISNTSVAINGRIISACFGWFYPRSIQTTTAMGST